MPETRATNPQEPRDEDFPTSIASAKDAAIFETFVVPRYLSLFAEPLVEKIVSSRDARVCHAQCRTGYPDRQLLQKLPNAHVYGCDDSTFAVELARAKAAAEPGNVSDYRVVRDASLPFPSGAFSHALAVHPRMHVAARLRLFEELSRILAPFGQALIALPLRGSFVELSDLLREYAARSESTALATAVEAEASSRPSASSCVQELERVGLEHVDVDVRTHALPFPSGRDLFEDPVTRLLLLPEMRAWIDAEKRAPIEAYVRAAVDKYWSDGTFTLTLEVGIVSARRRP